jgi:hypothetical protein
VVPGELQAVEDTLDVDRGAQVEVGLGDLGERFGDRDRGVVDQHVPPAVGGQHPGHHGLVFVPSPDVGRDRQRGPAGRLDAGGGLLGQLGSVRVVDDHMRPAAASAAAIALPIPVAAR